MEGRGYCLVAVHYVGAMAQVGLDCCCWMGFGDGGKPSYGSGFSFVGSSKQGVAAGCFGGLVGAMVAVDCVGGRDDGLMDALYLSEICKVFVLRS